MKGWFFIFLYVLIISNISQLHAQECTPVVSYLFNGETEDYSGSGYNAELMGGASVAVDYLACGYNTTDYAVLPNEVLDGATDFTISFDFYLNSFNVTGSSPTNTLIAGASATEEAEFAISYEESIQSIVVALNGVGETFTIETINTATWYCLTVKREGGDVTVYIDGISIGTQNISSGVVDISFLEIGQELDCPGGCFATNQSLNGRIDDFRIYNCITSGNNCEPYIAPCDTMARYRFEGNANDLSGNGQNGILHGGADASDGFISIGYNATDYIELPDSVLTGAGDFVISFNFMLNDFNTSGASPTNTFIAGINAANEAEFAISYEKSSDGFEIAFHDAGGVIPATIETGKWYCLTVYRQGENVWATLDGDSLPGLLILPLGEMDPEFLEIGQELDCVAGCFAENQCLNGAIDELIISECLDDIKCSNFPQAIHNHYVKEISVFPIPASNVIQISAGENKPIQLATIRNAAGQIIYRISNFSSQQLSVDIQNWPDGIYFIRLEGDDFWGLQKFVIEK